MTRNGVPRGFHSDLGSTYESAEFQAFCRKWGIEFSDSSPKHSQGNAIAEAHVKKVKHLLATAGDEDELTRGLLALMQTPVAPGCPSPAQMHYGRNLRDDLHPNVKKETRLWSDHKEWKETKSAKSKEYYDRGTRQLRKLEAGERVLIWHRERWQQGAIMKQLARPQSYQVRIKESGQVLERNRRLLRAVAEELGDTWQTSSCFPFPLQPTSPVRLLNPTLVRSG
jgi:hypothetical protein